MKPLCRFIPLLITSLVVLCQPAAAADSAALNQKGMNELHDNHPERAVEFFIRAIAAGPANKHYYNNLAAAYIRIGEYAKAEEQLKISIHIDGNYAKALSNMSLTLFRLGRYREAYTYYRLSKKADSEYTETRFDKKKVSSVIKKSSEEKPADGELKKIKEYIDTD